NSGPGGKGAGSPAARTGQRQADPVGEGAGGAGGAAGGGRWLLPPGRVDAGLLHWIAASAPAVLRRGNRRGAVAGPVRRPALLARRASKGFLRPLLALRAKGENPCHPRATAC